MEAEEKKSFFFAGRPVIHNNKDSVLHDLSTEIMVNHVKQGVDKVARSHIEFNQCAGDESFSSIPFVDQWLDLIRNPDTEREIIPSPLPPFMIDALIAKGLSPEQVNALRITDVSWRTEGHANVIEIKTV